jgi:hypothetical protein
MFFFRSKSPTPYYIVKTNGCSRDSWKISGTATQPESGERTAVTETPLQ